MSSASTILRDNNISMIFTLARTLLTDFRKNSFGNYVYKETSLLVSDDMKHIIGRQNEDGTQDTLSLSDLNFCRELNIPIDSICFDPDIIKMDGSNESDEMSEDESDEMSEDDSDDEIDSNDSKEDSVETKYKEMLIDVFVSKWEKLFENKDITYNSSIYNCKIKNIYGLEFFGYEIVYDSIHKTYSMEFNTTKYIDDIIPQGANSGDMFIIKSTGSSLKTAFNDIIDCVNKYIFCKHCGVVRRIENFIPDKEMCDCCLISECLMLKRDTPEFCSICLSSTKNYYTLRCGHKFHRVCLSDLNMKVCPNCRKCINEEDE